MIGQLLDGRYKITQLLGSGGFGQTYIAEDTKVFNVKCVVKQLKPLANDPKTWQVARRLFETEAQLLHKLGTHDQIPRLLAHFEKEREFYLVQELIEGHDLSKELTPGKRLSEPYVISLLKNILEPLSFVHQQNVIHRDIKPPNLIRRKTGGKIVLIDFGAVKQVVATQVVNAQEQTRLTVSIGTAGYMPSEQGKGTPRYASDIYAVGMIGIQALTGLMPPSGLMLSGELWEDPDTAEIIWRDQVQVSPTLAEILDKMVRYDFRQRYQSAIEAWEAVQQLTNSSLPAKENVSEGYSKTVVITRQNLSPTPDYSPTLATPDSDSQEQTQTSNEVYLKPEVANNKASSSLEVASGGTLVVKTNSEQQLPVKSQKARPTILQNAKNLLTKPLEGPRKLNITVFGPRGVGKTSLLAAMYHRFGKTTQGTNLQLTAELATSALLQEHLAKLQSPLENQDELEFTGGIQGTSEPQDFIFEMSRTGGPANVQLCFKDFPGGRIGSNAASEEIEEVKKVLSECAVVLIVVDSPALMEQNGNWHELINKPLLIADYFKTAYQNLKEPRLVLFVPSKCEKYMQESPNELLRRIQEKYESLLKFLAHPALLPYVVVAITPVQTLGNVCFSRIDVQTINGKSQPHFYYRKTAFRHEPRDSEQPIRYLLQFLLKIHLKKRSWLSKTIRSVLGRLFEDAAFRAAVYEFAQGCKRTEGFAVLQDREGWLEMERGQK